MTLRLFSCVSISAMFVFILLGQEAPAWAASIAGVMCFLVLLICLVLSDVLSAVHQLINILNQKRNRHE
ncbi:hypothetical protein CLV58_12549 [Spirosoma oryzae]|uniref:Uncharacterized protein n=1 Tax=Spirosoma oryzae TaxID=1469603 RepID=A0A2T0S8M6_9BACT|nr:hypothetical protein CLV58_12549 [Spirosoma oryzae]